MFYSFHQNNSGGRWTGPAINVIIEADSAEEANYIATYSGISFDEGCPCCGDRWYSHYDDGEATEVPSIYGTPVEEEVKENRDSSLYRNYDIPFAIVLFKDGLKKVYQ